MSGGAEFDCPQLSTGFCIKSAEAAVVGRADKDQTACGGNRAAATGSAGILFAGWQAIRDPKIHAPGEFAGIHVHSRQHAPWRLLAHHVQGRVFESSATWNSFVRVTGFIASATRLGTGSTIFETLHLSEFTCVQEQISKVRIE